MSRDIDFYFLVKRMRDCQKIFFKTRDRSMIYRCMELEKQVDKAIEAYMNGDVVS